MDDRPFKGVTPSMAGNGPRYIYLSAIRDKAVDPQQQTWAMMGLYVHNKMSYKKYTGNVISEEKIGDDEMKGIPDVLEPDEYKPGYYVLTDYKTYGSFKAAKVMGLVAHDRPMVDANGKPVLYKRATVRKGKKYKAGDQRIETIWKPDPGKAENYEVTLQLNRYRIFFEGLGYKISRLRLQITPRDANTINAKNRGITKNLYMIDLPIVHNDKVLHYYRELQADVDQAYKDGTVRKCKGWEMWNGNRCDRFCAVKDACDRMDKGEKFFAK
jgi:hypothetical protein